MACFADEGGGFTPCSTVCVALLCFEKSGGLDNTPSEAYEAIRRLLGWRRGELKWRSVKKAARRRGIDERVLVETILGASVAYGIVSTHLDSFSDAGVVKNALLIRAAEVLHGSVRGVAALVVDANLASVDTVRLVGRLLGAGYTRIGDSKVYKGIQLADLVAGACSEGLVDAVRM